MDLRDKIARTLRDSGAWDEGKMTDLAEYVADRILAELEIAEALSWFEVFKKHGQLGYINGEPGVVIRRPTSPPAA